MSTRAQLLAEIAAQFPDNTTGLITPAKLRQVTEDLANSCAVPAAGTGSVAAADITDASASGRTVLTGTPAQAREAIGFGGTVTVAQLNAAGADARSAMYYCSDCLTVNGPGSLVAWCSRTSTWRTLDDCLLATTSFAAWVSDFVANSNSGELRGVKGALFRVFENAPGGTFSVQSGAASAITGLEPPMYRRSTTGTTATAYARALGVTLGSVAPGSVEMFAAANGFRPGTTAGVTARLGLSASPSPNASLGAAEFSLCLDAGNVLGYNAGLSTNYLSLIREGGVNLAGTGATAAESSTAADTDLLVISDNGAVAAYVGGVSVATGTRSATSAMYPFLIWANDGTSTTSAASLLRSFCCGYLLP